MASHHSSHARTTGIKSNKLVRAAKPHTTGSQKGNINTKAGKTMSQPADRFPGSTAQMTQSGY